MLSFFTKEMTLLFFFWLDIKLTKKYALELGSHEYRKLDEGITFFDIEMFWDWCKKDHCPRFEFRIIILNIALIDFSIYNINHIDHEETEE